MVLKQWPKCNLFETDDALRFYRAGGMPLISYSSPLAMRKGPLGFTQVKSPAKSRQG